jgi:hypothetical protein
MSCTGFLTPQQRAALAGSSSDGPALSSFSSPPVTEGKRERVRLLAGASDPRIRESAALSSYAPEDVLHRLSRDPVASVRACVARNEHAVEPILRSLATDADATVRGWAVAHRAAPRELLDLMAEDPDASVRAVVTWAKGW